MQHHRKIILINRPFQLRFAFYVCSWLIALGIAYPLILSTVFDSFLRYLALDPAGPTLSYLEKVRAEVLGLLLLMQSILLLLTFIISIYMSHKIAGPLYRLGKTFKEAAAGNLEQKLAFRKKDYFHELASEYNEMMNAIRIRLGKTTRGIEVAIPRIEKALAATPPEVRQDLETALLALQQSQKN